MSTETKPRETKTHLHQNKALGRPVALNDLISSQFSLHQCLVLFCDAFSRVQPETAEIQAVGAWKQHMTD